MIKTKCKHEGCEADDNLVNCFYPDNETDKPNEKYCIDHCFEHGFCWGCGQFWGGVESFEFAVTFGGIKGLCENCSEEIRIDCGEYDVDDEELEETDFDDRYAYYGED